MKRRVTKCRRRKGLVATLDLECSQRPHFVRVFLWRSVESLQAATGVSTARNYEPHGVTVLPEWDEETPFTNLWLAEVHFSVESWNVDTVVHEIQHVIQFRQYALGPDTDEAAESDELQENVAFEAGEFASKIYRWLWQTCPACKDKMSPELLNLL